MDEIKYRPIGLLRCVQKDPLESPRQGVLAEGSDGVIELNLKLPRESLNDLVGFDRVWIIYDFHLNKDWKPFVRPPRGSLQKRGVLATRSPYRPNSIGLSCVRLGKVTSQKIEIFEHDLLDGTPILDIKPYLSYCDSFPETSTGWIEQSKPFDVVWTTFALSQCDWLSKNLNIDVSLIVKRQLEFDPLNKKTKRVQKKDDHFVFCYKTWRFFFKFNDDQVQIFKIDTGYKPEELNDENDPYKDKELHKSFLAYLFFDQT